MSPKSGRSQLYFLYNIKTALLITLVQVTLVQVNYLPIISIMMYVTVIYHFQFINLYISSLQLYIYTYPNILQSRLREAKLRLTELAIVIFN